MKLINFIIDIALTSISPISIKSLTISLFPFSTAIYIGALQELK